MSAYPSSSIAYFAASQPGTSSPMGTASVAKPHLPPPTSSLPRPAESISVSPRQRTANACTKCRERKTKCSGDKPVCLRCSARGLICQYTKDSSSKLRHAPSLSRLGQSTSYPMHQVGALSLYEQRRSSEPHNSMSAAARAYYNGLPQLHRLQMTAGSQSQATSLPNSPISSPSQQWLSPSGQPPVGSGVNAAQNGFYHPALASQMSGAFQHDLRRVKSSSFLYPPTTKSYDPRGADVYSGGSSMMSMSQDPSIFPSWTMDFAGEAPISTAPPLDLSSADSYNYHQSDSQSIKSSASSDGVLEPPSPPPNTLYYNHLPSTVPDSTPHIGTDHYYYARDGSFPSSPQLEPFKSELGAAPILANPSPRTPIGVAQMEEQLLNLDAAAKTEQLDYITYPTTTWLASQS